MINVYLASVLYRWCKVVYNHQDLIPDNAKWVKMS